MSRNLLLLASRLLAASQSADDLETASFYAAGARLALAKAKAEMKEIALVLREREAELIRRAGPKEQTSILAGAANAPGGSR
jgi:hypothetical protein